MYFKTLPRTLTRFAGVLVLYILYACSVEETPSNLPANAYLADTIPVYGKYRVYKLPIIHGVKISNPIQLATGPGNILYGANQTGEIYSLVDTDNDGFEDTALLYCDVTDYGLRSPAGFTNKGDTIYIGTAQQIRAFRDADGDGRADTSWVFFDQIPHSEHPYEWTTGLNFDTDGWLYVALGTDSWNAGPSPDPHRLRGSILKISPDGSNFEVLSTGIRSVPDMKFDSYGELFFIDNEGGGNPTEELNRVVENTFFGHNPKKYNTNNVTDPDFDLMLEVAPSGIVFNDIKNDFGATGYNLYVSYYGAGERWSHGGISRVQILKSGDGEYSYEEFPVADIPKLSALAFGGDGSLYVAQHGKADYWYNAVYEEQGNFYKLVYDSAMNIAEVKTKTRPVRTYSKNAIEIGKQLFAERACLGCHQVDGETELLGPNLKDVANRLTREEILEEIVNPSKIIKPSMAAIKVYKKDGQILTGRVVNSNETEVTLMMIGNHMAVINRTEIERTENEEKSLMYPGLINDLSENDQSALLDYIASLSQ
jgi:putative heme-binding domain-containing protein